MATAISGVFPALTTPFDKGNLSISHLKSNMEKFERANFSGYLVLGSTGEGVLMNERERIAALDSVCACASESKKIIAGTGMQGTHSTIQFTNLAARSGADYALVVTPFYFKKQMGAETLEAHYLEVAEKSQIPIIMYNVPKFTGLDLPLETIISLAGHQNIVGLKDSSGNIALLSEILKACPPHFSVLQGMGSVLFTSLVLGAKGGILALSNMAPQQTVKIFELVEAGELEEAKTIQTRLITVNQRIVGLYGVPGIKCALDLLGYFGGEPRPPLQPVSQKIKDSIGRLLRDAGLL